MIDWLSLLLSHLILSSLMSSCFMSCHFVLSHIMSFYLISYHLVLSHVMSSYLMSYHVVSYVILLLGPDKMESAVFKANRPESRKLYLVATAVTSSSSSSNATLGADNNSKGKAGYCSHRRIIHCTIELTG